MKCFFCDTPITEGVRFCPSCGAEIPESQYAQSDEIITAPDTIMESDKPLVNRGGSLFGYSQATGILSGLSSGNDPDGLRQVSGWNWGAFLFTWIWCFSNGLTEIGIIALFVTFTPLSFLSMVFLGLKGNELLWNKFRFESVQEFKRRQENWNRGAMLVFFCVISLIILAAILGTIK